MRTWRGFARNPCNNVDSAFDQGAQLLGIIRKKPNPADPKVIQYGYWQTEVARVGFKAECLIRGNRVQAFILEGISPKLRHESDAAPFLMLVDQDTASFLGNTAHRQF